MGLAMPEISWRRSDQFGYFMTVLKLGAVNLNDGAWVADERLRSGFHCPCFPGTRGAQEQEIANRSAVEGHPSEISLISPDDLVNRFVLSNDEVTQVFLQILGLRSRPGGIEYASFGILLPLSGSGHIMLYLPPPYDF
jgi:hypothetical protein